MRILAVHRSTRQRLQLVLVGLLLGLAGALPGMTPQEESKSNGNLTVVKAGTVITVSGETLKNASIVIRNGIVEAVGTNVDYPFGAHVIDVPNSVVMPGLIDPVSAYVNLNGGRGVKPNQTFGEDLFIDGDRFEPLLAFGYTTLGLDPRGGPIPGRELVVRTSGKDTQAMTLTAEGPIKMTMNDPRSDKSNLVRAFKSAHAEIEKIRKAREAWEKKQKAKKKPSPKPAPKPAPKPSPKPKPKPKPKSGTLEIKKPAKAKDATFKAPPVNPLYRPLVDLIEKKKGVTAIIEFGRNQVNSWGVSITPAGCYEHLRTFLEEEPFAHSFRIFNGVVGKNSPFSVTPETDVNLIAEALGKEKALVALFPNINHYPYTRDQYNLGLKLFRAGCKVVYLPEQSRWSEYAIMFEKLARMVRYGFPREEILKTVTLHPAEMLGMSDRLGSIEKGKEANLVFLSGDPLAFDTRVEKVMIRGELIPFTRRIR